MVMIDVIDVHDETLFDDWYAVMRAAAIEGRRAPSVWTHEALSFIHRNQTEQRRRVALAARTKGAGARRVLGTASVELPLDEDTETAEVSIHVHPSERGRGVGAALWGAVLDLCHEGGRAVIQTDVNVPVDRTEASWPGMRFARARGFVSENVEDHFALDAAEALTRLGARGAEPARTPGPAAYGIVSWVDRCPDDLVDSYAAMRTLMNGDVPTGGLVRTARSISVADLRRREARLAEAYRTLVSLARTASGEPAGYSVVHVPLGDPDNLLQDDTYVMRAHRGHRLGERLKWANLAQVRAIAPGARWIHTWTERDNAPMQRTNRDFGYVPVEVTHEMQVTLT